MTLTAIFSILNNVSIRRNICLNFRMFIRENKPLFWQKWTTDVFSYFRPPCWCPCTWAPTWRPILISINLCETLCQITRVWNTAQTWGLDRVLIYISSIACKFLDFIHWMVFDFYFDGVTVKTGNWNTILYIDYSSTKSPLSFSVFFSFDSKRESLTSQGSNFIDHQSCVQSISTYYPNILGK